MLSTRNERVTSVGLSAASIATAVTSSVPTVSAVVSIVVAATALSGSPSSSARPSPKARSGAVSMSSVARTRTWIEPLTQASAPGVGGWSKVIVGPTRSTSSVQ